MRAVREYGHDDVISPYATQWWLSSIIVLIICYMKSIINMRSSPHRLSHKHERPYAQSRTKTVHILNGCELTQKSATSRPWFLPTISYSKHNRNRANDEINESDSNGEFFLSVYLIIVVSRRSKRTLNSIPMRECGADERQRPGWKTSLLRARELFLKISVHSSILSKPLIIIIVNPTGCVFILMFACEEIFIQCISRMIFMLRCSQ